MKTISLHGEGINAQFCVDEGACSGLVKVAGKVVEDYNEVTGEKNTVSLVSELSNEATVFAGIVGESPVLSLLEKEGKIDLSDVTGKWEVYKMTVVGNSVVIAGSDRLGTIYGMFAVSELMGVSPLRYISDSVIKHKDNLMIAVDETVSREPSVKFRGFFINDEWPCFGNWTVDHFGGFTAEMYDNIFELLLRLKGNYLWPAMWSSSFALDGPGLRSYELASEYGIYIGNSHHEPCLRAGEEYSKVRGKDSIYGDAWNFHTNTEGITRFWRDSLMERGSFESMITVGMRGEADSTILGADATLKDNIDLLKKVIVCQKQLIKEAEEKFNKKYPKVLALYKEVEPFYYGDENTEGLCDWDELQDVIMMLCEDNYGYLRTVPDDKMRNHPAGFGMYYHVDYHGSPISYEWINSSPLTTMWEQMSQAYDYGVRSVWILNVGDLKHNEFPLSYFLNLAYDFDKYGTSAPNTTYDYTKKTVALTLGRDVDDEITEKASRILTETVRLNGYRRPEALNSDIYHSCHFDETDRMIERVDELEKDLFRFEEKLDPDEFKAWYSLSGFQTRAAVSLIRMHLYGAKNQLFAKQGLKAANVFADLVASEIRNDKANKTEWQAFANGKWKGHEMASHIGFTKWNEDGCRYPLKSYLEPFERPRMYVTRVDDEPVFDKVYGPCMRMIINDFEYAGTDRVVLRASNMGVGGFDLEVTVPDNSWLTADISKINVTDCQSIVFTADFSKLTEAKENVLVTIKGGDTKVEALFTGRDIKKIAEKGAVLPKRFGYAVTAGNFDECFAPEGLKWVKLEDYGVYGSGMKVYPSNKGYEKGCEPSLSYNIWAEEDSEYTLQMDFAPTNPLTRQNVLGYGVTVNGIKAGDYNTVPDGYRAGEGSDIIWSIGALDHRRRCYSKVSLKKGVNKLTVSMNDPGLVPMKMYLYKEEPPKSYFGMPESVRA